MQAILSKEMRRRQVFKPLEARAIALKAIAHNSDNGRNVRWYARVLYHRLIKHTGPVCFKNRCFNTGRSRGYLRFFNLSRIQVRALGRNNELPFIQKASW